jgi:dTDP-4-amino-4,6-dideoxygalactose transaminase
MTQTSWHYTRPTITDQDRDALAAACHSPLLTQGPQVAAFEQAVTAALACPDQHAIAVSNGSAALYLAALALGVRSGSRVWTTPLTFVATVNALKMCQARVELIDIDPQTWLLEPQQLAVALAQAAEQDRLPHLLVAVDFAGLPCDWPALRRLADQYQIRLLADSCQGFGAQIQGQCLGCAWADITVFSFHPAKSITTGEGGMLLTPDQELADWLRSARTHGLVRDTDATAPWCVVQHGLGFNCRLTEFQAALGIAQLERLPQFLAQRERLVHYYRKALADYPVTFQTLPALRTSAQHLCVGRFDWTAIGLDKLSWFRRLQSQGLHLYVHYLPIHCHPAHADLGYAVGCLPEAERYYEQAFSLPLYPDLTLDDAEQICEIVYNTHG